MDSNCIDLKQICSDRIMEWFPIVGEIVTRSELQAKISKHYDSWPDFDWAAHGIYFWSEIGGDDRPSLNYLRAPKGWQVDDYRGWINPQVAVPKNREHVVFVSMTNKAYWGTYFVGNRPGIFFADNFGAVIPLESILCWSPKELPEIPTWVAK